MAVDVFYIGSTSNCGAVHFWKPTDRMGRESPHRKPRISWRHHWHQSLEAVLDQTGYGKGA